MYLLSCYGCQYPRMKECTLNPHVIYGLFLDLGALGSIGLPQFSVACSTRAREAPSPQELWRKSVRSGTRITMYYMNILCTLYYIYIYCIFYILYTVYYILYTAYYIPYTTIYVLYYSQKVASGRFPEFRARLQVSGSCLKLLRARIRRPRADVLRWIQAWLS